MAKPRHGRIIFSGVLGTASAPTEEWTFSLGCGPFTAPGSLITEPTAEELDALAGLVRAQYTTHVAPRVKPHAILTRTQVVTVGADGHYERDAQGRYRRGEHLFTQAGTGSATDPVLPFQTALAVTLETEFPGPTGRGRFFLPAPVVGSLLAADGRMSTAAADAAAAGMAAFVGGLNDVLVGNTTLSTGIQVVSGGSATRGIAGGLRPVVAVSVGRVPDTIRSRRGDLEEDRRRVGVS